MKISSNYYYDYYNQSYGINSVMNSNSTAEDTNSSQDDSSTVSSISKRRPPMPMNFDMDNTMDLNSNGRMLANSMRMQDIDPSQMSEKMDKIKSDMDSIKSLDIDSMSSDDVKKTLTNLKTDMEAMPTPDGQQNNSGEVDLDSLSETDLKNMLKDIQNHASRATDRGQNSKMAESFNKIKNDMDNIKSADIDSMSADEIKSTLENLKTDLDSVKKPYGAGKSGQNFDLDNMSEEDMKTMLKNIQERAKKNSIKDENIQSTDAFSKVKNDMDSIKDLDIDSLSSEDIKNTLTQLDTDLKSLPRPGGQPDDSQNTDIDSMSEADMKEVLKQIQERAKRMSIPTEDDTTASA